LARVILPSAPIATVVPSATGLEPSSFKVPAVSSTL